jgi:dTDP-4-amino-4,6-dideoxygalactose transaminase
MIPHSRPWVGEEEAGAVAALFRSGWIAEGPEIEAFEAQVAAAQGRRFAVAANSGTAALHLALLALGVGAGDEVLLPSYTCTALLLAVRYTGASPVLVDLEPGGFHLSAAAARAKLSRATRAMVVPYTFGFPADPAAYEELGLPVIGDIAQAFGASWQGQPLGKFHTLSICSFYATKVLTCIQGGAVLADDVELAERCADLRSYAGREDPQLRYGYRLGNLNAAVGLVQLGKLPAMLQRRRQIAARYRAAFSGLPLELPPEVPGSIFYRFPVRVPPENRSAFVQAMADRGIVCGRGVQKPLHRIMDLPDAAFPTTAAAYASVVSLPLYPALTAAEVDQVVAAVVEELPKLRPQERRK